MHISLKIAFPVVISALLAACGGGGGSSAPTTPVGETTPPAAAPEMESFTLLAANNPSLDNDLEFTIEGSAINARLPSDAEVTSLVPTFTFAGATTSVNEIQQTSGSSAQDFTDVLTYVVTNADGDSVSYEVDLTRFTGLPIIYLTTNEAITSKEDYVDGTFRLDGARGFESIDEMPMEIRGRGHSTWGVHPKKPYQMKLESKRSVFGMLEDKKWLFLAEYSDKTLLRNRLAFELGYLSRLVWTPHSQFAEVFVNGEHDGIYHITEKVEDGDNRVDIGDTGFLMEIDQRDRLDPDDVFFETGTYVINIKEPNLAFGDDQYLQVSDQINAFETVLFSENFADPDTGYAAYIDIDSFIDWFLINEIAKNVDAQWYSSIYLHWVPGDKIKMGPIWDFDLGFGNVDYADPTFPEGWWVRWNTWISRLLEDPVFAQKVQNRFAYFNAQRSTLKQNVNDWASELQLAQTENDSVWGTMGQYVWPNPVVFDTYDEEVAHLIDWFDTRMDWIAEALDTL